MIRNYVLETANAPGTNLNVLLAGAQTGRQTWRQAYADGAQAFYFIDSGDSAEWGICTVHWGTPNTISRDTVVGNTGGGTGRINFTGAVQVYNEIPGERMPWLDRNVLWAPGCFLDPHAGGVPVGASVNFWGTVLPAGWVWVNGQALSRTAYPFLFAQLGTRFGAPDANTFNVPNVCEQFTVGAAFMGGAGGLNRNPVAGIDTIGHQIGDWQTQSHQHTLQVIEPPGGHTHAVSDPQHQHFITDPGHAHGYSHTGLIGAAGLASGGNFTLADTGFNTNLGFTGINITGFQFAGISVLNSSSGINVTMAPYGGGGGQNNPPAVVCNVILYAGPVP